jgi:Zn-dependent protease/CBS domain-containing protein
MHGTLRLGKLAGVEIGVHFSWLILFALVAWSVATGAIPELYPGWSAASYWSLGALAALTLFVSILTHELSHSLLARARGLEVDGITLFLLGGVSRINGEAERPGDEFWIAVVGPLTSFALGGGALLALLAGLAPTEQMRVFLLSAAETNVLLGIFNLLPGFPLDGGRILRAALWKLTGDVIRATGIAAWCGRGVAALLIFAGLALALLTGNILGGLWLTIIGWFLSHGAAAGYRQALTERRLGGHTVGEVMQTEVTLVPPTLTLRDLVEQVILRQGRQAFPVVTGDRLLGIISADQVRAVPARRWGEQTVAQVMAPPERLTALAPEDDLAGTVDLLDRAGLPTAPVVKNGRLVGLLSRDQLAVLAPELIRPRRPVVLPAPEERRAA